MHCLGLDDGTYAARWKDDRKSLEIVGVLTGKQKWATTEYTVSGDH